MNGNNIVGLSLGIIFSILVAASLTWAQSGDPNYVHACVKPNGMLQVVGPEDTCAKNETALDWPRVPIAPPFWEAHQTGPIELPLVPFGTAVLASLTPSQGGNYVVHATVHVRPTSSVNGEVAYVGCHLSQHTTLPDGSEQVVVFEQSNQTLPPTSPVLVEAAIPLLGWTLFSPGFDTFIAVECAKTGNANVTARWTTLIATLVKYQP